MTYVIENVKMYKRDQIETLSLLVDEGKILSVQPSFPKYLYMKMNANNFVMTSTKVFLSKTIPDLQNDNDVRDYFTTNFIMNGCTTILAVASVEKIGDLEKEITKVTDFYCLSPLDFTIGVKVPVKLLTVPLIQKCKKLKIPAIFIEYTDKRELYKVPWGWIREAMFPYNSPLIPVPKGNREEIENLLYYWQSILNREKIPHISKPIQENTPLNLEILKKIGIYPLKGYLQAGGELSYNLYLLKKDLYNEVENKNLPLVVIVHKGEIIRVGNETKFIPENGEELKIMKPSFLK